MISEGNRTYPVPAIPWRVYGVLFFLLAAVYGTFVQDVGPNQLSRLNLTLALAHEGRLEIDTYTGNSIDRAYYNGHYYSDKAPLISFLAYPVYQALRVLQGLDGVNLDTRLMLMYLVWVINSAVNVPLSALLILLFLHVGRTLRPNSVMPWFVAAVLAFGTLLFPYATLLFGHNIATLLGFAPLAVALYVRLGALGERWLFLAGLLAGLGVVAEYPNGLFALALVAYVGFTWRRWRPLLWVVAGGIGPALGLGLYNTLAFDHPLRFSYMFHAAPWGAAHRQGLLGVQWPQWEKLVLLLFSPRGLFFLSPVLLLSPFGYWAMYKARAWRDFFWLCFILPLVLLILNAGYFYTLGGAAPGPRFLVPVLPYLALPLVFLSERWLFALVPLGLLSVLIQGIIVVTDPMVGRFTNPLVEYWGPMLVMGDMRVGLILRQRYGIPFRLGMLLIVMCVLLWPILGLWGHRGGDRRRGLLNGMLVGAFLFYLMAAFPVDIRSPRQVPALYLRPSPPVRDDPPPGWTPPSQPEGQETSHRKTAYHRCSNSAPTEMPT